MPKSNGAAGDVPQKTTLADLRGALNDFRFAVESLATAKGKFNDADEAVRAATAARDEVGNDVVDAEKEFEEKSAAVNQVIKHYVDDASDVSGVAEELAIKVAARGGKKK